jgi:hypothetical protein
VKKEEEEENGYDAYEDDFEVHVILLQFDFFFYPRRYATGVLSFTHVQCEKPFSKVTRLSG